MSPAGHPGAAFGLDERTVGRREQLCGGNHPRQSSDRVRTDAGAVPARVCSPGVLLAQVVKTSLKRRVVQVSRRIVRGSPEVVAQQAAPFVRRSYPRVGAFPSREYFWAARTKADHSGRRGTAHMGHARHISPARQHAA